MTPSKLALVIKCATAIAQHRDDQGFRNQEEHMIDTAHDFLNALRVLHSIDMDELENAGVIRKGDLEAWTRFREGPANWAIRADDDKAEKLWALVQRRMRPRTGVHPKLAFDAAS